MAVAAKKKPRKASKSKVKRKSRMADFPKDCYSVMELAKLENVIPNTVRNWIANGLIEAKDHKGYWAIPKKTYKRPISQAEATKQFWAAKSGKSKGKKKPAAAKK